MATNDIPVVGWVEKQVQTNLPPNSDSTIMDDTSATMENSAALMGGQTVSLPPMKQTVKNYVPKNALRIRR